MGKGDMDECPPPSGFPDIWISDRMGNTPTTPPVEVTELRRLPPPSKSQNYADYPPPPRSHRTTPPSKIILYPPVTKSWVRACKIALWSLTAGAPFSLREHPFKSCCNFVIKNGNQGEGIVTIKEKAFDRVPWEVVWWALRYLGLDEWIVLVIRAMYEDVTMKVRLNESKTFNVTK